MAALAGGLAGWVRVAWVEAQGMAARCALAPAEPPCGARQMVIELFQHHRLSLSALGLAVLAGCLCAVAGWRERVDADPSAATVAALWRLAWWAAGGALCIGAWGLVLYDADASAWAVVAGAWAAARASAAAR